jgi:CheY-like chemotaxis protein
VREALRLLRASLPATIDIRTNLPAGSPAVLADPTQVHQILMNLGSNAAYAMREHGGRLELTQSVIQVAEHEAPAEAGLRPGRYVRLSVSDTGHGMDPATLEHIFEPFYTTKPPGEGTGLGLAVVHGIMQAHEGRVAVWSQPGAGTTFHLDFPAAAVESPAAPQFAGTLPLGSGQRILFVDDEPAVSGLANAMLQRLGYVVETYNDPSVALEAFRRAPERYDLVMTDLTMPHHTGVELARQLRQARPGVPILLMSGFAANSAEREAQALHIDEWLTKPFSLQGLASAVLRALRLSSD